MQAANSVAQASCLQPSFFPDHTKALTQNPRKSLFFNKHYPRVGHNLRVVARRLESISDRSYRA